MKKNRTKDAKKIRIILVLNDTEAMVMFPSVDNRADMREAFYGNDPKFLEWCNDYFDDCHKNAESFTEKEIRYFDKDHVV